MLKRFCFCLGLMLIAPALSFGQTTVVNPTSIEFTASPDHNATAPLDGTPLLTRYDAKYYLAAQCNPTCPTGATPAPSFTISLGKPAPGAQNKILVSNVFQGLVLNQPYKAVVVGIGPGGSSPNSNTTDPFGNRGPLAAPAPPSEAVVR